jgi:uncharacterized protein YceK
MLRLSSFSLLLLIPLSGCGSVVTTPGEGGSGTTSTHTSSTSNTEGCTGSGPECWASCDLAVSAECNGGSWSCPPGSSTSYPSACNECFGLGGECDVCNAPIFDCQPTTACLSTCPEVACESCPLVGMAFDAPPGCFCECNAKGELACTKVADCCATDMDCGDLVFAPCVEGVCKQAIGGGQCWSDAECPAGTSCVGAFVCPCGYDCDQEDHPGSCEGPP